MKPKSSSDQAISWSSRLCRSLLFAKLRKLREGCLTVVEHDRETSFGDLSSPLRASIYVQQEDFFRRVLFGGGLGAAEAMLQGKWASDDLTVLVRIFARNMHLSDGLDRGIGWLRRAVARCEHAFRRNTPSGSKRNILSHYDLGNEFYRLFLDETMSYSSGIFPHRNATMYEASVAKLDRVCTTLNLRPDDHLLEIGSGWGGLAVHAAKHYGCRVTTTTISDEQYQYGRELIQAEGLEDRVTLLRKDYRTLTGTFDKLVSIEMIEAVGHEYFAEYFRVCGERLKPDGMMLLQGIVIADERYRQHLRSVDFIRRYIFPGGCLPSVSVMTQAAGDGAGMRALQMEDITPHYAETLRHWRSSFHEKIHEVRALGFDERFIRMWDYYLCYCEAGFEERQTNVVQLLLGKRDCRYDCQATEQRSGRERRANLSGEPMVNSLRQSDEARS
ncbi:MAG: SAM-dependent methyltransferase [Blastopirellula sp.]|nr:SAM-dependent methyltransferase [Blastopirellula sp.]